MLASDVLYPFAAIIRPKAITKAITNVGG
jgi:hypothetical protein